MRQKLVKRYYCDHCSKGSFKEPSMRQHEYGCIRNPDRVCYLCESIRNFKALAQEAKARSSEDAHEHRNIHGAEELAELLEMVDQCPACLLSVLRQADVMAFNHFNYKDAVNAWHREKNFDQRL